jgi:hypothetical protein
MNEKLASFTNGHKHMGFTSAEHAEKSTSEQNNITKYSFTYCLNRSRDLTLSLSCID